MNSNLEASLHSAVVSGNLELVCSQIDCGAPVNALNDQNETPLHLAVEKSREDIVRLLLEKGACSLPDKSNFEPLLYACFIQSPTIVELLLHARTPTKLSNPQSLSAPLIAATQKSNQPIVSLLLKAGADPNAFLQCPFYHHRLLFSVSFGTFPLHLACHHGHLEIVRLLVEHKAEKNCLRKADSYQPLHLAAENNHVEVVSYLLSNGVDPDVKTNDNRTALHLAAKAACVEVVKVLLSNNASLDSKTNDGSTPLLLAVQHQQEEVVKILLEHGACVNDEDESNKTPLLYAVEKGNLSLVNSILQFKPNVSDKVIESVRHNVLHDENCSAIINALIEYGVTLKRGATCDFSLLLAAVNKGRSKLVEYLLAGGVDHGDRRFDSVLWHNAVKNGNDETVKLLQKAGCNVKAKNKVEPSVTVKKQTNTRSLDPLVTAVKEGQSKLVEDLLASSVDRDDERFHSVLLHTAVENGNDEIIKLLLKAGCDVNAKDKYGNTPICYVLCHSDRSKHLEIFKLLQSSGANVKEVRGLLHKAVDRESIELCRALIEFGCDVNAPDRKGKAPLHHTAPEDVFSWNRKERSEVNGATRAEIARLLLENGANINAKTDYGSTTLHFAVMNKRLEVFQALMEFKANVNIADDEFVMPLHIAVTKRNKDVVKSLLENGADVDALTGEDGVRPIHISAYKGQAEILKLLLQFGANINAQDVGGNTPLHCAIRRNRAEIVNVLLENDCDVNIRGNAGNTALGLVLENFVNSDSDFPDLYKDNGLMINLSDSEEEDLDGYDSWGSKGDYDNDRISKPIVQAVRNHIMKLRVAGLFISKWNEHLIEWADGDEDEKLQRFIRKCYKEVERMKKKNLCSRITLYHVLATPVNPAFARNLSAIRALDRMDLSGFPIYHSLLLHRSKFNLEMNKLFGVGKKWLSILFKTRNILSEEKLPSLPVELLEEIVVYLNKMDLKRLISCGEDLKRQVCK